MNNTPGKRKFILIEGFLSNGDSAKKKKLPNGEVTPLIDLTNSSDSPQNFVPNEVPVLHPDEQFGVDHPEDPNWPLMPGARVYVKFFENYCPAIICGQASEGYYKVYDVEAGYYENLSDDLIVSISKLKIGVEVNIDKENDAFIIKQVPKTNDDWFDGIFNVQRNNGNFSTNSPWNELYLSKDQVKQIFSGKTFYTTESDPKTILHEIQPSTSQASIITYERIPTPTNDYGPKNLNSLLIENLPELNLPESTQSATKKFLYFDQIVPESSKKNQKNIRLSKFERNNWDKPSTSKSMTLNDLLDDSFSVLDDSVFPNFNHPLEKSTFEKCKYCDFSMRIDEHPEIVQYFICKKCKVEFCRMCLRDTATHAIWSCDDMEKEEVDKAEAETQQCLIEEVMNEVYETHTPDSFARLCTESTALKYYSEIFIAQFENMLKKNRFDELARIYEIWENVDEIIDQFQKRFEDYIMNKCQGQINAAIRVFDKDPKPYVNTVFDLYTKHIPIIQNVFKNNPNFGEIFEECGIFHGMINKSLLKWNSDVNVEETLIRYCDFLLIKKSSTEDKPTTDLEDELAKVALSFKFVPQKILLCKFYYRTLSKRLMNDISISYTAENLMLIKLKDVFGEKFIERWRKMIEDAEGSQAMVKRFRQHTKGSTMTGTIRKAISRIFHSDKEKSPQEEFLFSTKILSNGVWPLYENNLNCKKPTGLMKTLENFECFYLSKNMNRSLTWVWQVFKGEVVTNDLFNRNYTFLAAIPQVTILMLFNKQEVLTMDIVLSEVGLEKHHLMLILTPMIEIGLVKFDHEVKDEDDILDNSLLLLNLDFSSPRSKIDLAKSLANVRFYIRQCEEQEDPENQIINNITNIQSQSTSATAATTNLTIRQEMDSLQTKIFEQDNRFIIQAAIVRIMKASKNLEHKKLIENVQKKFKGKYKMVPSIKAIKNNIDVLVEKEFLNRAFQKRKNSTPRDRKQQSDKNVNRSFHEESGEHDNIVYEYIP